MNDNLRGQTDYATLLRYKQALQEIAGIVRFGDQPELDAERMQHIAKRALLTEVRHDPT